MQEPAKGVSGKRGIHVSGLFLAGVLSGILLWGGFNTALEATNTESFCISCHEMRAGPYKEYRSSIHARNRSGVRASCPDCHVPRSWGHKILRKISASRELIAHFLGRIDTPEAYEKARYRLAEKVWERMRSTDSRPCRNCHDEASMDLPRQYTEAARWHRSAEKSGSTCIECHQGIAHRLPEAFLDEEHERFEREKVPCYTCHRNMAHAAEE